MIIEPKLRKLARSSYWQNIYKASKDCNGINLFINKNNFSGVQSLFLYWLSAYSILYDELNSFENDYLTNEVIISDIRTDAYLFVRRKNQEKDLRKQKLEEKKQKLKFKNKGKVQLFDLQ